jgi:hypothetical protein
MAIYIALLSMSGSDSSNQLADELHVFIIHDAYNKKQEHSGVQCKPSIYQRDPCLVDTCYVLFVFPTHISCEQSSTIWRM